MPSQRERRSGSYEVYVDVRHHPKHNDDFEQRESTAFKFVDTGNPREMVLNALREFADDLEARWAREDEEAEKVRRRDEAKALWEERNRA